MSGEGATARQGLKRTLFPAVDPSVSSSQHQACLSRSHGRGDNSVRISKGQGVYVYSEECAWQRAEVVEVNTGTSVVSVCLHHSTQVSTYHLEDVLLCWESHGQDISNLTHLNPVHEATILSCLERRFEAGMYYTNAGNTVVAVNPYCDVGHLYSLQQIQAYHNKHQGLPPHIYPVAENAYTSLLRELGHVNQSIIISGESGAGKTESTKHLLRYLTIVANPTTDTWSVDDKGFQIEQRVVDSNPILEAFGNAATMRNDNSSRFGKFIQLQFLRSGRIQGGAIQTYLLEKTRIMNQAKGENNFHIFYQMTGLAHHTKGYPGWVRALGHEMSLNTFQCVPHNQDISENGRLRNTLDAMTRIGLTQDSQRQVFEVLLAVLYLGNLSFVQVGEESSGLDRNDVSGQALERSSDLLGLNPDHLRQTLLHRWLEAGGRGHRHSVFVKPISVREACNRRDILAMLLYSRLFDWLVGFINSQIKAEVFDSVIGLLDIYGFEILPTNSLEQLCINYANERLQQHYVTHFLKNLQMEYREENLQWEPIDYRDNRPCVTLLDGKMSVFSLLNEEVYLNRKSDVAALRGRVVSLTSDDPRSEGVVRGARMVSRDCHKFIVRHYAGDVTYCVSQLVTKNKDDIPNDLVSLLHGSSSPFLQSLFSSYMEPQSPTGRKRKTVLTKFKSSLDELMSSLGGSDVHYIRCLRPNVYNRPDVFQAPYVLQQLRACGTLESVDICCKGFPARMHYSDFLQRYTLILRSEYRLPSDCGNCAVAESNNGSCEGDGGGAEEGVWGWVDEREEVCEVLDVQLRQQLDLDFPVSPSLSPCINNNSSSSNTITATTTTITTSTTPTPRKRLRRRAGGNGHGEHTDRVVMTILQAACTPTATGHSDLRRQFGTTKIFLTQQQLEELECARTAVLHHSATCLQAAWRGRCSRRQQHQRHLAAKTIATAWRAYRTRQRFLSLKRAAFLAQCAWRTHRARREFTAIKASAIVVQRWWKAALVRRRFLSVRQAAVRLQRAWLCVLERRWRSTVENCAAVLIQKMWRMWRARRDYLLVQWATVQVQTAWAMRRERTWFLTKRRAAVVIQRGVRRWLYRSHPHPNQLPNQLPNSPPAPQTNRTVTFTQNHPTPEEKKSEQKQQQRQQQQQQQQLSRSTTLQPSAAVEAEEEEGGGGFTAHNPQSGDGSFDTVDSGQPHGPLSAQLSSDFSELSSPVFDGNQSDDSGVMVMDPPVWRCGAGSGDGDGGVSGGVGIGVWAEKGEGAKKKKEGVVDVRELVAVVRRMKAVAGRLPRCQDVRVGDSIVSRRRIVPGGVKFHTRASVLPHGHVMNRRAMPYGLLDLLEEDLGCGVCEGHKVGSSVDP